MHFPKLVRRSLKLHFKTVYSVCIRDRRLMSIETLQVLLLPAAHVSFPFQPAASLFHRQDHIGRASPSGIASPHSLIFSVRGKSVSGSGARKTAVLLDAC